MFLEDHADICQPKEQEKVCNYKHCSGEKGKAAIR